MNRKCKSDKVSIHNQKIALFYTYKYIYSYNHVVCLFFHQQNFGPVYKVSKCFPGAFDTMEGSLF